MRPPPPKYGRFSSEQSALEAIVQRLTEALKPFRIYLFGSRAEGRARPDSDFDLVVVFDDDAPNSDADYEEVYAPVRELDIGCDVIPCRWSDFQEVLADSSNSWQDTWEQPAEFMSGRRRRIDACSYRLKKKFRYTCVSVGWYMNLAGTSALGHSC